MKSFFTIKYIFTILGIGLLVGAALICRSTYLFLEEAIKTEGTVVKLVRHRSNDSTIYRPVIQFTSQNEQVIEFTASVGSNPPSYSEGEKVEVLYHPENPKNAKINGLFSLWGASVILGVLGGAFFAIGSRLAPADALSNWKEEYLKKNGTPIETEYQGVERNTDLAVNGSHPFRILTRWRNPSTAELHIFKSNDIWFDPTNYIKSRKITVFIKNGNPKKYYVDLSFLPKLTK